MPRTPHRPSCFHLRVTTRPVNEGLVPAGGDAVELGMITGAWVNEKDIHKGLFTPDVPFPKGTSSLEEKFFSKMLMALSSEGKLMLRYGEHGIEGKTRTRGRGAKKTKPHRAILHAVPCLFVVSDD